MIKFLRQKKQKNISDYYIPPEKNDFQGWKKLLMRKQMVDSELASIYVNKTINDYGTVCHQ